MDEVEILLKEYSKKDKSDHQKNGDDSMEYNIAKSKLRAVYGKLKKNVTLKQLSLQRSVTRWLGKTRPIGRQSVCLQFLYICVVCCLSMNENFLFMEQIIKSKNFTRDVEDCLLREGLNSAHRPSKTLERM